MRIILALALGLVILAVRSEAEKPSRRIDQATWDSTSSKIASTLAEFDQSGTPIAQRSLVIFHIGNMARPTDSVDLLMNNVKIFINAVRQHTSASTFKAFYLFNVVDLYNPVLDLIPLSKSNVAMLKWSTASSDLDVHLRTMRILGRNVTDRFHDIIFANQGVRGPLVKRKNGEWIGEFKQLLLANNVGLVGPTMSCEVSPHVQTHMFAIRTSTIPTILSTMRDRITAKFTPWQDVIAALEVGLTGVVIQGGYNVSSFLYSHRGQPYFRGIDHCLKYTGPPNRFDKNPVGWCGVTPTEQVFIKWGGEPMRTRGMICNDTVIAMENMIESLASTEPEMNLVVPEHLMGGVMTSMFKEYIAEAFMDRHPVSPASAGSSDHKVCFLVRVISIRQDKMNHQNPYTHLMNKDIELLITSLRRQSNPRWRALFYRVDSKSTDAELSNILNSFGDPRLELFRQEGVPDYSALDGGYGATDFVLQHLLQRKECRWISVTTSDNAYGSQVVGRILHEGATGNPAAPSMVLVPMDSRRFLEQDMLFNKKFLKTTLKQWDYCSLLSNIEQTGFTYAFRPSPMVGKLDIASVFFSATKLIEEGIAFSHFNDKAKFPCLFNATDPINYPCLSNQGSHMVDHLTQRRMWKHIRLPIDGLRSVIFQGNSPTLCIGAGDVWIDSVWRGFIDTTRQMCITPKDALSVDPELVFDMEHFFHQDHIVGTCYRARDPRSTSVPFYEPFPGF